MRVPFNDFVERGRDRSDPEYGTKPGSRYGAFRLRCPLTSERLLIMVSDGEDWSAMDLPGPAWEHVSVSLPQRCPTWEEMCWVKDLFFALEECVVQFHVPASEHINFHPHCLHLWRLKDGELPRPPAVTVGPERRVRS